MKTSNAIRFGPALLGLALFATTTASAHTVRSRPARGVVESLDVEACIVRFAPRNGEAPTELALTSRTKFVHNWHFVPAEELKNGTTAVVHYRSPFFGRPFVTKVVWVKGE